ncbi:hypothetical protein VS_II0740 [Vibrio atlanticus]|jgi:hypothetical protein|uniref:Uncharacterized protein n=1 Tax=Vibrio atlanticus (strain LGP32) TaxID=575788 RepID=B7VRZ1_VIBA3|nr:hypothetical protein VS_II0740 [Vibrio atlanticus]
MCGLEPVVRKLRNDTSQPENAINGVTTECVITDGESALRGVHID